MKAQRTKGEVTGLRMNTQLAQGMHEDRVNKEVRLSFKSKRTYTEILEFT